MTGEQYNFGDTQPGRITSWADSKPPGNNPFLAAFHTLIRILLITIQELKRNNLSLRSGALTYTILLSLVPMLAMSTAVVKGLGGGDQLKRAVYSYIETLESKEIIQEDQVSQSTEQNAASEPTQASSNLTDHIYSAADKIFAYVERTNFATLGTIGVAGIFLSVVLVLSTIEMAMNAIWHVGSGRSILRKISDYLTLIILFPLSINIGFAASAILRNPALFSKLESLLPVIWIQAILLKLVPFFFITLTLFVTYLFFPNTKVKNGPALIGALFSGFFWIYSQNVYFHLQIGVAKYNAIYGSFATLPLFLIWLYVGWLFILTGAQLAFAVQNRDHYPLIPRPATPAQLLSAAFDIVTLVFQSFDKRQPANQETIRENLPQYTVPIIDQAVSLLITGNLLRRIENNGQLLPAGPEEKLGHGEIIQVILGTSAPDTFGGTQSKQIIKSACDNLGEGEYTEMNRDRLEKS